MDSNETKTYNQTGYYYVYEYEYEYGHEFLPGAKESYYIALGLQWLNTVLIISLNTAVIITIYRYKKKSRLYFLLMNMAIADLVTGVIDAFVNALERSMGVEYFAFWWFGGDFFCRLQRTFSSISMCASNFILAATSIDRAFVVAKPMMSFKRGYTLQKILIFACWLLSIAINSPLFKIISQVKEELWYIEGTPEIPRCRLDLNPENMKIVFYLMFAFYFLIPLITIVVSYVILIQSIYKRARTPPNSVRGVDNLKLSVVFNKGLPSSKTRSIKLTLGIVLSFIVAWTPFMAMMYLATFKGFTNPIIMPFVTTYYWNCLLNPIIFFVFHRRKPVSSPYSVQSSETLTSRVASSGISVRDKSDRIVRPDAETVILKSNSSV